MENSISVILILSVAVSGFIFYNFFFAKTSTTVVNGESPVTPVPRAAPILNWDLLPAFQKSSVNITKFTKEEKIAINNFNFYSDKIYETYLEILVISQPMPEDANLLGSWYINRDNLIKKLDKYQSFQVDYFYDYVRSVEAKHGEDQENWPEDKVQILNHLKTHAAANMEFTNRFAEAGADFIHTHKEKIIEGLENDLNALTWKYTIVKYSKDPQEKKNLAEEMKVVLDEYKFFRPGNKKKIEEMNAFISNLESRDAFYSPWESFDFSNDFFWQEWTEYHEKFCILSIIFFFMASFFLFLKEIYQKYKENNIHQKDKEK